MAALLAGSCMTSCSDILEEQPRGTYDPSYFQTDDGMAGGLTGLYQNLRYLYGNMYWQQSLETGTDEYTYAQSADNNWKDADMSGVGQVTASSMRSDNMWGQAFKNINTCNSLLKYGEGGNESLLAEARFFRAFYYFHLVQTFGGVPLDLGSGELQPNISTSRFSKRNTVPEVYKVIFDDLEKAVASLPDAPRYNGTVAKNTARLFLAKAYLTYAWWLENPNNIATYPECSRNSGEASSYFQKAYDMAVAGIDNPGPFGLMPTYYDVHIATNDHNNKELLLYADHTEKDGFYNGGDLGYAGGGGTENTTAWATTWNYTNIRAYFDDNGKNTVFDPLGREAAQDYGRPWTRQAPTQEGLALFNDRDLDSRYDGTFVTAFRGNWQRNGKKNEVAYIDTIEKLPIEKDGIVLLFTNDKVDGVIYPEKSLGESNMGAGKLAGCPYFIVEPNMVSRLAHPILWKYSTYRTDNNGGMGSPNGAITRPFPVAKFSELYLVAAEAAVKGATGTKSAADLVNVLRKRAGNWGMSHAKAKAINEDHGDELVAKTPATIDIDYILDERAREFYGEALRWYDLVRTQTWEKRASSYTIADNEGKNPKLYERKIEKHYYLRPIPQGQLDAMEMTEAEKKIYQNPGY